MRSDGWVCIDKGYWAFFVSGMIRAAVVSQFPTREWKVVPSDPPLYEADLETAKALAVALYRLEV